MNEFDYDVMLKKRIAASAKRRVNGSKSRKCSLPSDFLTPAEFKKRSGPCMTYKLSAPMDWATFKAMPVDLQDEYIDHLQREYHVGLAIISVELFGAGKSALAQHLKARGITAHAGGKRLNASERIAWEMFLTTGSNENTPVEAQETTVCATAENIEPAAFNMAAISAEWVGEFNAREFIEQLASVPIPAGKVKIRLEVVRV